LPFDGGADRTDRPVINLVRFGSVKDDLLESLAKSIEAFIDFIGLMECVRPVVLRSKRRLPDKIPDACQGSFFVDYLEKLPGNIVIGVTDIAFYDPSLQRNMFGYGYGGKGMLSTFRFLRECENRQLFHERTKKEIIKILALACGLSACNDKDCIVVYHRTMQDLDRNTTICPSCRKKLVESLQKYLEIKSYE